ncbi:ABC transporter permease [Tamlana sp. 2_MG-2023]|uniref:ABC transporter permease n=1 Tax=unclassified Tamlana TaxID=2614803 RepID=UPI0026E3223A|nr:MULTISPECIES: ABC transporter permease [unclassified Tamlana]MDO6759516.1 ABC transporter permease [Tamlana sp. 2_MG-2023]MDO6790345.1 ABC transporter permease [Tamlana sp. 1_MG-2023]
MNLWKISIQNIKSKPLYTVLSVVILALSIILLLGIQQLKNSFEYQMENNLGDIDMVIGAKGSPLQLVLASILHLDNPTGNISYHDAKKASKNPLIKLAIPISYGDNYKGFRIVGTTKAFPNLYHAEIEQGLPFENPMEVVLGSTVAEQLGLKIGDKFLSSHGLAENTEDIHDDELTVVGILKPTQKVIDRLIITSLQSIWDVHDHDTHNDGTHGKHDEHEHEDDHVHHNENNHVDDHLDEDKEITSLLVSFRSPTAFLTLPRKINQQTNMQAAMPKFELNRLYEFTGVGFKTISIIAYLILIISGIIMFTSLYKMVKERTFDLAILRTYGASHFQLIKIVAYEGFTIALAAFAIGFVFVKVGFKYVFKVMDASDKVYMLQELPHQEVLQVGLLVFIITAVSVLLAIYPILKMNISTILSHEK